MLLVLHISLRSFGDRGEKFIDECVCVCVGGGGGRVVALRLFCLSEAEVEYPTVNGV